MILVVALNPALDVTHHVPGVDWAGVNLSTAAGADKDAVALAAQELRAAGPQAVVVKLGADGLWALTADGNWQAVPPADVRGNPTGAGDAVAAGLVQGLVLGPVRPADASGADRGDRRAGRGARPRHWRLQRHRH